MTLPPAPAPARGSGPPASPALPGRLCSAPRASRRNNEYYDTK